MIRIRRRTLVVGVLLLVVVAAVAIVVRSPVVRGVLAPTAVADPKAMDAQRGATERGVQRAYTASVDQIQKSRELKLAITPAQADPIFAKGLTDLKALRHSAFVSLAQQFNASGPDAERYAALTEQRFDAAPAPDRTANEPVLLAPRLFAIVQRMDEVSAQITDQTIRALTAAPTAPPSSSR